MAVTPSLSRAEEIEPVPGVRCSRYRSPLDRICFAPRRAPRRLQHRGNGCQVSEIYDTNRHCFLPSHFDFLLTKCRKARRRMQEQGCFAARNSIVPPAVILDALNLFYANYPGVAEFTRPDIRIGP